MVTLEVLVKQDTKAKAEQFVKDRRVAVFQAEPDQVAAEVRGLNDTYKVGFDPGQQWWCECPANTHGYQCSHIVAVALEIQRRHNEGEPLT